MLELNISQQLVTVVIASVVLVSTYSSRITTEDCDLDMRREVRSAVSVSVTFPIS